MQHSLVPRVLAIGVLALGALHCSSSSGGDGGGNNSQLQLKCAQMCEKLVAAPLLGCGKSDAASVETCKPECYGHVTPKSEGEPPEASEADLDCAIAAQDCATWEDCGDLL
jgi:hypothetical protein